MLSKTWADPPWEEIFMTAIPAIAFAAYSGTGKTTLIEKLVRLFKSRGYRVAVIKHDGHRFQVDKEGKDSWRFTQAGADITVISSQEQTAFMEHRPLSLDALLGMVHDVDLILVEGYKNQNLPQIGIARQATGKGFPAELSRYVAIVTDMEVDAPVPRFGLEDIEPLADFIRNRMGLA